MDPQFARTMLATGLFVFLLSLLLLPSLEPDDPAFMPDVLAIISSGIFLVILAVLIRRASRSPLPLPPDDEEDEP